MRVIQLRYFILLACALSACTSLTTTSMPGRAIDDSFNAQSIRWESGRYIYFSTGIWNADGKVGLCGALAQSPGGLQEDRFDEWLINTAKVELDDRTLVNGLGFFSKVRFEEDVAPAGRANCIQTSVPWSEAFEDQEPQVLTTRSRFKIYD